MESITGTPIRFAVYARTASDVLDGLGALEQATACISQISTLHPEWVMAGGCNFVDAGASGFRCDQLPGLGALIAMAQEAPRLFDCVVIKNILRLGRDLPNVGRIIEILSRAGVAVYVIDLQAVIDLQVIQKWLGTTDEDRQGVGFPRKCTTGSLAK